MVRLSSFSDGANPNVSVIIPTYNRLAMLEEALASVFSQKFDGTLEVIVVDDHSQDDTSEMITQNYPEVKLIRLEQNLGSYVARNQGLKEARGKYIAFLDSDDLWQPRYLQSQITALEGHKKSISVSAILLWYTTENLKFISLQKPNLRQFTSPIHQLLVKSNFIQSPSAVVFSRQVFEQIGLFDENFRIGADRELYARCFIWGYQPLFTEEPLVVVRKHNQGQLTDITIKTIELRKKTRIAYLEKLYPLMLERKLEPIPIHRLYGEIHGTAARQYFKERHFLGWILSWIEVVKYTSIVHVTLNIMRDLLRSIKKYLPPRILKTLRKYFVSNTFST